MIMDHMKNSLIIYLDNLIDSLQYVFFLDYNCMSVLGFQRMYHTQLHD